MTVFDAIKNGIASVGDPFKQFHGVGFDLAKLSPVREKVGLFVGHFFVLSSFRFIERSVSNFGGYRALGIDLSVTAQLGVNRN